MPYVPCGATPMAAQSRGTNIDTVSTWGEETSCTHAARCEGTDRQSPAEPDEDGARNVLRGGGGVEKDDLE